MVDFIIMELKDHMICYKLDCSHWWKIYLQKKIFYKICCPNYLTTIWSNSDPLHIFQPMAHCKPKPCKAYRELPVSQFSQGKTCFRYRKPCSHCRDTASITGISRKTLYFDVQDYRVVVFIWDILNDRYSQSYILPICLMLRWVLKC